MSEEEKKAIEYLKNNCLARIEYDDFGNEKIIAYGSSYKYILLKLIEKQDKIIDLMAEMLRYYNGSQQIQEFCIDICEDKLCDEENCKQCIIEHFRKKVEND